MMNNKKQINGADMGIKIFKFSMAQYKKYTNKVSVDNETIMNILSKRFEEDYNFCKNKLSNFVDMVKNTLNKIISECGKHIKSIEFDETVQDIRIVFVSELYTNKALAILKEFDVELQEQLKAVEEPVKTENNKEPGPGVEPGVEPGPGPGPKNPIEYLQSLIAKKMKALLKAVPALPQHILNKLQEEKDKEKEEYICISNNIEKAINDNNTNMKQNIGLFTETTSLRASDMVNMNKNLNKQWVQDVVTNCFYMHQSTRKDEYKKKLTSILDNYIDKRKRSKLKKKPFDRASFSTIIWTLTKYTPFEKLNDLIDKILDLIVNDLVDQTLLITE